MQDGRELILAHKVLSDGVPESRCPDTVLRQRKECLLYLPTMKTLV